MNLKIFETKLEISNEIMNILFSVYAAGTMGDTSATGGPFSVALSGGSLPTIMALRNNYSQDQLETIRKWYQQLATKLTTDLYLSIYLGIGTGPTRDAYP